MVLRLYDWETAMLILAVCPRTGGGSPVSEAMRKARNWFFCRPAQVKPDNSQLKAISTRPSGGFRMGAESFLSAVSTIVRLGLSFRMWAEASRSRSRLKEQPDLSFRQMAGFSQSR